MFASAIRDLVSAQGSLIGGLSTEAPGETAQFRLLGPLQVSRKDRDCTPSAPKVRQVLSLLFLRCNHTVSTDSLIYELWGEHPPPSAVTTVQTYVYHLRKIIDRQGLADDLHIFTRSPGYCLRVDRDAIDVARFESCCHAARAHMGAQEWADAAANLRRGLDMWSGPPLSNVALGPQLSTYVDQMHECWKAALRLRIDAEMRMGMHLPMLGELRSLVATYPFDEWLHGRLMLALERCGRRSEALTVYRDLSSTLATELGLDPSVEVQQLHREILTAGGR